MSSQFVKLVVFVPETHADSVRRAMGDAGCGKLGNYSHCSFSVSGIGRFKPLEGAHPAVGRVGRPEEVREARVECICERGRAKAIIAAVRKVHPYEEVALDVYPLIPENEL